MKKIYEAAIVSNACVADDIFKLIVSIDASDPIDARAGQFVQLRLPSNEFTLRRPFGIAALERDRLTIFYRIVGRGTQFLSTVKNETKLDLLAPLGNGFAPIEGKILLVGGGLGLAPLLFAARQSKGADVLIGGKTRAEAQLWLNEFGGSIDESFVSTDDGSFGVNGFVTDLLPIAFEKKNYDAILVCGPEIVMKKTAAFAREKNIPCQVSLESRMGCGLGACLSCSIDTVDGRKKICKDGPIFDAKKIIWG